MSAPDRPAARALVLAAGAAVVWLLLDTGRAPFAAVPLLVGLVYLAAAVVGGRGGAYWAPGCVVTGWGVGNLAYTDPALSGLRLAESAAHMLGIGLGVLALAALVRAGVHTTIASTGLAVVLSGTLFALQRAASGGLLNSPDGYALLLLVFAAAEGLVALGRRR